MKKWKYLIVDLHDGVVKGTNDHSVAQDLRHSEEHFVIDHETGAWMTVEDGNPVVTQPSEWGE